MNDPDIRKFVHELNNSLNTANINSALIRRLYGNFIDAEILDRLDTALGEAEKLSIDLQSRTQARANAATTQA